MKAQELRAGNLVNITFYDIPMEVQSICSINDEIFNRTSGEVPLDSLSGIPLTEEWLVRFGLVLDTDSHQVVYMNKPISIYKQDGIFWCDILWDSLEIKSVHQLQNLYFALTGEELLIK